jgi:glycosyltransferase involved in cell wall biosynthesis
MAWSPAGKPHLLTGSIKGSLNSPAFDDYGVVVVQRACGRQWFEWIKARQRSGVTVIYEVDDDLHAAGGLSSHPNRREIKRRLPDYELCIRAADAVIVSTPPLVGRLRRFNKDVFLCEAGIDFERYQLERPARAIPAVGFSGGVGHEQTLVQWLPVVREICDGVHANFISIGVQYRDVVGGLSIPTTPIESYPGALANMDVVLAPAIHNDFFRAKSELRWIEASAMGIPVVGDPFLYSHIEDGETGLSASTSDEAFDALKRLLDDPELRVEIGRQARSHVRDNFHIDQKAEQWVKAFEAVVGARMSPRRAPRPVVAPSIRPRPSRAGNR